MRKEMRFFLVFMGAVIILPQAVAAKSKQLDDAHICRAAISTIFDEKPEDIEAFRQQLNVHYLRFPQSDKNKIGRFKCIVQEDEIIWATELGSYRNTEIDSDIVYDIEDNVLIVQEKHKNGSVFRKAFDIKKLTAE